MAAAQDVSPELLANLGFHNAADLEALRGFVGRPLGVMPRRSTRRTLERYPDMEKAGLEAVPTVNNGNCFFAAISDQLYGNDGHSAEYRAMAVKYILERKDHFMPFTAVKRGGGTREVAKRKNAGGYSVTVDHGPASLEAIELQFNSRMAEMAKDRTYVDQQEIWALAAVLGINIRIFEPASTRDTDELPGNRKPVAAIAYDPIGQHYSSVRRVGDPRTGPAYIEGRYEPPLLDSIESQSPAQSPGRPILSPTDLLNPDQWARSRSSTPGSISIQRDDDEDISSDNPSKRSANGRKIRTARSRKPSNLSKKISAAPTPSTLTSRAPSLEAIIVVAAPEADSEEKSAHNNQENIPDPLSSPGAATTLPSPPYTQSRSPSLVILSDDGEEEDETPVSPRKIAQRRRSSKREERDKAALLNAATSAEKIKKSTKKPTGKKSQDDPDLISDSPKLVSETRRGLKRGTRRGRVQSAEEQV